MESSNEYMLWTIPGLQKIRIGSRIMPDAFRIFFLAEVLILLKISIILMVLCPDFILQAGGYKKLRHSLGLVATAASASIMGTQENSWKFVDALWNAKLEPYSDGYFDPYYDGMLYLFSIMHLSGNYQIIKPRS